MMKNKNTSSPKLWKTDSQQFQSIISGSAVLVASFIYITAKFSNNFDLYKSTKFIYDIPWLYIVFIVVLLTIVLSVVTELIKSLTNSLKKNGNPSGDETIKKFDPSETTGFKERLMYKLSRALPSSISNYQRIPNDTFIEMIGYVSQIEKIIEKNTDLEFSIIDYENIGDAIFLEGRYEKAIQYYDEALKINPKEPYVLFSKGVAYGRMGNHKKALEIFNEAIEINDSVDKFWVSRGAALAKLQNYEESLNSCEKALKINDRNCRAWNNKGIVYMAKNDLDRALDCFDRAIKIDSWFPWAHYNKACLYAIQKNSENVFKFLERAIEIEAYFKRIAIKDRDFQHYWEEKKFKKLVNIKLTQDEINSVSSQQSGGYFSDFGVEDVNELTHK